MHLIYSLLCDFYIKALLWEFQKLFWTSGLCMKEQNSQYIAAFY